MFYDNNPAKINRFTKPHFFQGGDKAILLIHGYTGSPREMLWLGTQLHKAGYTVSIFIVIKSVCAAFSVFNRKQEKVFFTLLVACAENAMSPSILSGMVSLVLISISRSGWLITPPVLLVISTNVSSTCTASCNPAA